MLCLLIVNILYIYILVILIINSLNYSTGNGFNYYHHPNNIPLGTVFQGADNDSDSNGGIIDGLNFSLFTDNQSHFGIRFLVEIHRPKFTLSGLGSYKIKNTLVKVGISNIIDSIPAGFTPLTWIEDTNANTTSSVLSDYLTTTLEETIIIQQNI